MRAQAQDGGDQKPAAETKVKAKAKTKAKASSKGDSPVFAGRRRPASEIAAWRLDAVVEAFTEALVDVMRSAWQKRCVCVCVRVS